MRRRDVLERVDQHDRVAAAGGDAPARLDRALDRLRLGVGRDAEAELDDRLRVAGLPVADLLRAHAGEDDEALEILVAAERAGEAAQRLGLAGARAAGDDDARAAAERRQPLDRLQRRVLVVERDALARPARR